jgi:hypothetical protein
MTMIDRRAVMAGIAATTAATAALAVPAASAATTDAEAVLAAWRAWRPLEEELRTNAARITELHRRHPEAATIPGIEVLGLMCMSESAIDGALRAAPAWMQPAVPRLAETAKRELRSERDRLEKLDESIGTAQLQRRQDEVVQLQDPHVELIESAQSSAPVVLAAQLDLALAHLDQDHSIEDIGPGLIAAAVRGLLPELPDDMREKLAPIAAGEGKIGEVYRRAGAAVAS